MGITLICYAISSLILALAIRVSGLSFHSKFKNFIFAASVAWIPALAICYIPETALFYFLVCVFVFMLSFAVDRVIGENVGL